MNPYRNNSRPKYDFNNPEDFRKLERMAYDMTIEIENFPPAAYRYFDKLRILYARYKYDGLGKSEAAKLKQKLFADYTTASSEYKHWCEVHKAYQDNIRKADVLMSEIEKSEDTAVIAVKACEIVGLLTGEENFTARQKRKIKDA